LSLRSAKSAKSASPATRQLARRTSPKCPLKRTLTAAPDAANLARPATSASPRSRSRSQTPGQENTSLALQTSFARKDLDKPSRHSLHLDASGSSQTALFEALDEHQEPYMVSTTGALKRSDRP
jgi:mitosis inhibitor protein kinase SWE1